MIKPFDLVIFFPNGISVKKSGTYSLILNPHKPTKLVAVVQCKPTKLVATNPHNPTKLVVVVQCKPTKLVAAKPHKPTKLVAVVQCKLAH